MPKQFINLIGDHSPFQEAVLRVSDGGTFQSPIVVAANEVRFIVAEQLAQLGVSAQIVLEPVRRDSAAAVAVGTLLAARRDPDAVALVLPADHVVGDVPAFAAACREAAGAAARGQIATLGVLPRFPATGYGYIKPGERLATDAGAFRVERFVEKPSQERAATYVDSGFLWNGGYFLFRADIMVEELQAFAPEVLAAAEAALAGATADLDFIRLDRASFERAPKTSIDFAVMEHTTRAAVVPVSFPWSDIGNWGLLWDASARDDDGNVFRGRVESLRTRNSLVHSDDVLTAVVGVEDVVVVATRDAVLVTSRAESDAMKDLVEQLRAHNLPEADEHVRMYRPWGWYQRIDSGSRFQVKRICVSPGARLSLQKHYHRAEHWVVVKGTASVTVNDEVTLLHENQSAQIPIGALHRLANPGKIPLEIIEVQVGTYTGEDDIVRVEDVYGR
jgi:mannose-1-phosphate guanylyltransferase/mannose-6-phosphate isomerase